MCRQNLSILRVHQLRDIAHSRLVDSGDNFSHAVHLLSPEEALEEPETPIRTKLSVANNEERVCNVRMLSCHHPPHR